MRSNPHHWFGPDSRSSRLRSASRQTPEPDKSSGNWSQARLYLILALTIAFVLNLVGWRVANPSVAAPDTSGQFNGVAYNAFGRWDNPVVNKYPPRDRIEKDLAVLAERTRRIRTYSSSEFPDLPQIANQHAIKVTAGVWLDSRLTNNEREISAVVRAVSENRNIERIVVGNETLLHGAMTLEELTGYLRRVRNQVSVPVSTAEPWHVWLQFPQLARHVDYVLVHLLPYWEGVPHDVAVDYALKRYRQVQRRFPDKHIVVGEIGWPSNGDRYHGARTGNLAQAQFMREFLAKVDGSNLDYFVMEAIDQPWKLENEGRVGSYWGLLDAYRTQKFAFSGPLFADPQWGKKATIAGLLGLLFIWLCLRRLTHLRVPSQLFLAALIQACVSMSVWLVAVPFQYYLRWIDWLALLILAPTLCLMLLIVLANAIEFAEMFWPGNLRRKSSIAPLSDDATEPFVSVHLACCNEQPEMVIATIRSLAALDYRNYEVIVVDNNTADEQMWQPVKQYMQTLDSRFRFYHLPQWPGFKAGALNFALDQTDPKAQIIGVVDADYVVSPSWLRSLVGGFADAKMAVVQAPQAHRDWAGEFFRRMMNWEFDGFFRIGMHHRNERNAIIQHGTMTLVRASALRKARWCTDCICEDAELGLRLMRDGWKTIYVDRELGRGLTADSFAAFRKQRHRWAQGAMQIMRLHVASLFLGRSDNENCKLTAGQRYHFVAGWMSWIGDAMHLVFALAAMFWTLGIIAAPHIFSLPILLFMLPVFAFFFCRLLLSPLLFVRRVGCSIGDVAGAALAGMSLSHGIARGIFAGLIGQRARFEITDKAGRDKTNGRWQSLLSQVREELFLLSGLLVCIIGMGLTRDPNHFESLVWMTVLVLQALPYVAALLFVLISALPMSTQARLLGASAASAKTLSAAANSVSGSAAPLTAKR